MHRRVNYTTVYYEKPGESGGAPAPTETQASSPAGGAASPGGEPAKPAGGESVPTQAQPPAGEAKLAETSKPVRDWKDDRIAKLTHDLNEERRKSAAATPAPKQNAGESDADFQRRVDEAANQRAVQIAAQADWDRQCNAVAETGRAEFKDFDERLKSITSTINGQDAAEVQAYNEVIAAAIETGQAHKVIYALGADPGEYQRLMKMSPIKRAMELGRMATKLVGDREPSNLPKPITPVNSTGEHYEGIRPDDPQRGMKLPKSEWYKQREAQARERGIQ